MCGEGGARAMMATAKKPTTTIPTEPKRRRGLHRYRVVIWFAVALAIIDSLVAANSHRWRAYDPHPYQERLARCRQHSWDLIVAGGSPAMCGIDPTILIGAAWRGAE